MSYSSSRSRRSRRSRPKTERDRVRETGLTDEVLTIRLHNKVTKGGRKLSFAALVAVGDGNGRVGIGYGKGASVPIAIEKGTKEARRSMVRIKLVGSTIAHEVLGAHGSARVLLRPATPGTGVKAGSTVRSMLQVLGVENALSKIRGSGNPINVAKATLKALMSMRSVAEVEKLRGVNVELFHPQADADASAQPDAEAGASESA